MSGAGICAVGAFRCDPAVKATVRDRLAAHVAAGTLTFGPTCWDGTSGSALGVSIEGTEVAAYTLAFGYPLSLAALLDQLLGYFPDHASAGQAALAWIDAVQPGANLLRVPARLAALLLDEPTLVGKYDAIVRQLKSLHERDGAGDIPTSAQWVAVRDHILSAGVGVEVGRERGIFDVFEAAAWPATRGRSTLVNMVSAIARLRTMTFQPGWSEEQEAAAMKLMEDIWEETEPANREGKDYLSELRAREPVVWAGFTANLHGTNNAVMGLGAEIAEKCTALFRAA